MSEVSKTAIMIRVQARGGKFLADDIGGSEITVRDAATGERLGGGWARGVDSGTLGAAYSPAASPYPIITPAGGTAPATATPTPTPTPTIQWLATGPVTTGLQLDLPLSRPTLLAIAARGPLAGLQSMQRVETTVWALPGQPITAGPGLVIDLPGLVVQVQSPATHTPLPSLPAVIEFQVKVTMMCGCQIAPGEPWLPADFTVEAVVTQLDPGGSTVPLHPTVVPLSYAGTSSLFAGSFTVEEQGFYQASVRAIQHSTGNIGTALVTFFTPPPAA